MSFITRGTGKGEFQHKLEHGLDEPGKRRLIIKIEGLTQVKNGSVLITSSDWVKGTADMAQLAGDKLEHALGILDQRIANIIAHHFDMVDASGT